MDVIGYDDDTNCSEIIVESDCGIIPLIKSISLITSDLSFIIREINYHDNTLSKYYKQWECDAQEGTTQIILRHYTLQDGFQVLRYLKWSYDRELWVYFDDYSEEEIPDPVQQELNDTNFLRELDYIAEDEDYLDDQQSMNMIFLAGLENPDSFNTDDEYDYAAEENEGDLNNSQTEHATIGQPVDELPQDTLCSICLNLPIDPLVTSCSHFYCSACITAWLYTPLSDHKCPNCKRFIARQ